MDETEFYEEHEFSFSDFENEPMGWMKKLILVACVFAVIFAIAIFSLTAFGRGIVSRVGTVFGQSFGNSFGFSKRDGVVHDLGMESVANADEIDASSFSASGTALAVFPETLPLLGSKKSARKKVSNPKITQPVKSSPSTATKVSQEMDDTLFDDSVGSLDDFLFDKEFAAALAEAGNQQKSGVSAGKNQEQVYPVSVSFSGDGRGFVTSTPIGIACDGTGMCTWHFPASSTVVLRASHDTMSSFGGWSGPCSGTTLTCSFVIRGPTSLGVAFHSKPATVASVATQSAVFASLDPSMPTTSLVSKISDALPQILALVPTSTDLDVASNVVVTSDADARVPIRHILISAVQIAGDANTNDLVRLVNPTGVAVDMSDWKLHKRSKSGADYSIKTFPKGTSLAPGSTFVWANSTGGFSDSIASDVASTQTLAEDNSILLLDANSAVIDAVAWGNAGGYGEGPPFPTNPAPNQLLTRKSDGGVSIDTDNNANDFYLK